MQTRTYNQLELTAKQTYHLSCHRNKTIANPNPQSIEAQTDQQQSPLVKRERVQETGREEREMGESVRIKVKGEIHFWSLYSGVIFNLVLVI